MFKSRRLDMRELQIIKEDESKEDERRTRSRVLMYTAGAP